MSKATGTFIETEREQKLRNMADMVIGLAKEKGASASEVGVSVNSGLSVEVRMGELDTVEFTQDQGFAITVYFGQRKGSASTADTSEKAVRETVAAACEIAKYTSEDPYAGLADPELMAKEIPDLDLFHPWDIDAPKAMELAKACEEAALQSSDQIKNSEGATVSSGEAMRVYANSHGFIGSYRGSRHGLSCVVIAGEKERMQRDYWYSSGRLHEELMAVDAVGRKAAERALSRLDPKRVKTGNYPVAFAAELAPSVIGHLMGGIQGGALYRKSSFLLDSLGEKIFPEFVQIYERPRLPQAIGSVAFDGDGLATYDKHFVKDGVIDSYILGTYSARKLGMQSTANAGGVHNIRVDSTGGTLDGLLQRMGTGLLVTEVMGQGVNMVTGDYSRGASGFWVEDGKIQYPVQELTIASNLKDMFAGIQAIGDDVDRRGNVHCGTVLIESMKIAGE